MRAAALVLLVLSLAVAANAATIVVDAGGTGDHLTISDGIAAAVAGDTVQVMTGAPRGFRPAGPPRRDPRRLLPVCAQLRSRDPAPTVVVPR